MCFCVAQYAKGWERRKSANEQCVSFVLTGANPTTSRHTPTCTHTLTCTHVLGDKCGESSPSVRVVIRLPSINTRGCRRGLAAGVWAYGCVSASVYLCMSVFFLCVHVDNYHVWIWLIVSSIIAYLYGKTEDVSLYAINSVQERAWWPYSMDASVTGTQQQVWTQYKDRENMFKEVFVYTFKVNEAQRRKC